MILTIGGPDYSGKTTLINKIKNYYKNKKNIFNHIKIFKLPFSENNKYCNHSNEKEINLIKSMIKSNENVEETCLSYINYKAYFYADKYKDNDLVILDRGFESTLVYQGTKFIKQMQNYKSLSNEKISDRVLAQYFAKKYTDILNTLKNKHKQIILIPELDVLQKRANKERTEISSSFLADKFEKNLNQIYKDYLFWLNEIAKLENTYLFSEIINDTNFKIVLEIIEK